MKAKSNQSIRERNNSQHSHAPSVDSDGKKKNFDKTGTPFRINSKTGSDAPMPQESKVGQKLSDMITRRVIILVLCIMISVPIFTEDTYKDNSTTFDTGMY